MLAIQEAWLKCILNVVEEMESKYLTELRYKTRCNPIPIDCIPPANIQAIFVWYPEKYGCYAAPIVEDDECNAQFLDLCIDIKRKLAGMDIELKDVYMKGYFVPDVTPTSRPEAHVRNDLFEHRLDLVRPLKPKYAFAYQYPTFVVTRQYQPSNDDLAKANVTICLPRRNSYQNKAPATFITTTLIC
jgi:hypothetical protein